MKKIGFVDYYISEWHANNYPAWIKEVCQKMGAQYQIAYAWAELDVSPEDNISTAEWCAKYGIERCMTLKELCEKSDCILVLAPSNPEKHLAYAEEVLKYGKRTYIDKTFAPDYGVAKQIFEIGAKYNTPFFSSSALRYSDELKGVTGVSILTTGGGRSVEEYIIHQAEMVVKVLGTGARKICLDRNAGHYFIKVQYDDGRNASIVYADGLPFSAYVKRQNGEESYHLIQSDFFKNLIADIIRFYETGEKSFDSKQTLEVMKIRESIIKGLKHEKEWIFIEK